MVEERGWVVCWIGRSSGNAVVKVAVVEFIHI